MIPAAARWQADSATSGAASACARRRRIAAPPAAAPRRIQPAGDVFAGAHLEMKRDLFIDLVVDSRAPGTRLKMLNAQLSTFNAQLWAQAVSSTREMAVAKRAHSAVCAVSCRRPRGVSR